MRKSQELPNRVDHQIQGGTMVDCVADIG
jgi:hypothetical protein